MACDLDRIDHVHAGIQYSYDDIAFPPISTAHGTYYDGEQDDVENLEEYQEGGYHPIDIDSYLDTQRYRVVHKLGHGAFGTVWLCRDHELHRYVAVKVMTADVSLESVTEISLLKHLDQTNPGARHIALPLDNFQVRGPNGTHQCIVFPLLGQSVSPVLWQRLEHPGLVLRNLCRQAVLALNCLHESSVGHGGIDFRPSNILIKVSGLDDLSEDELLSQIGYPEPGAVVAQDGGPLPPFSPRYLVPAADMSRLDSKYLREEICLIRFGQAYLKSSPPPDLGTPENYLPPERLVDDQKDKVGLSCDIWALGCTLFEIRLQTPLFHMLYGPDEVLDEMVSFFGKFPEPWWSRWQQHADYRDDEGNTLRRRVDVDGEPYSIDSVLRGDKSTMSTVDGVLQVVKTMEVPRDEMLVLKELLLRICAYAPENRPCTGDILRDEWFSRCA
ncbi:Protein kinase-like domain protein [Metarhizium album ARSEF 1941]|uniref:Protein kinase-like domain protein n=1 Tax=Metarhizium album (strain ARSEF 1941) TaxID=1081103 RepID=A0A0B2WNF8_METAS|nr:Protein kinase-like domain protein [Metarhizium album ARSEF 1941]KHN95189.1 Protein kinase-like domain protein [Metarhizium album ARSEF 1941]